MTAADWRRHCLPVTLTSLTHAQWLQANLEFQRRG